MRFGSVCLEAHFSWAGGPALIISVYAIPKEGAPSLRFLQGWAAMLLVPFDFLCNCVIKPLAQAFPNPALRKVREGRGTHFVDDRRRDQRPGHPPSRCAAGISDSGSVPPPATQRAEARHAARMTTILLRIFISTLLSQSKPFAKPSFSATC